MNVAFRNRSGGAGHSGAHGSVDQPSRPPQRGARRQDHRAGQFSAGLRWNRNGRSVPSLPLWPLQPGASKGAPGFFMLSRRSV